MSDFTEDLVGANQIEVTDEDGKVIHMEKLKKPQPAPEDSTAPKSITMTYIVSTLIGEVVIVAVLSYFIITSAFSSLSQTYVFIAMAIAAVIVAGLLWYGIKKLRKWAWWGAIILLVIGIPLDFLILSVATIIAFIFDLLVLYYLTRKKNRAYFGV